MLNIPKTSTTLLGFIREKMPQGRPVPSKLKRQTGEYRESQLPRAEMWRKKPPWEPAAGQENLNYG